MSRHTRTAGRRPGRDGQQGIILPIVLIIALLLSAAILTFVRRSVVDSIIVRNRQAAYTAEALARGGIRIATGMIYIHRYQSEIEKMQGKGTGGATLADPWSKTHEMPLVTAWGGRLTIRIEDAGARLNINALVPGWKPLAESQPPPEAEEYLKDVLERIIDDNEFTSEGLPYDPRELARNLIDYMDADDVAIDGHNENEYYLAQDPPRVAPNRPLLSVDEIAMVQGFDVQLVEALKPYLTVHPLLGDTGINLNTAPPHVLSLVYHGSSGDKRLADEDIVRDIMQVRSEQAILCNTQAGPGTDCRTLSEVGLGDGSIYPEVVLPMPATVYLVTAEAEVGSVVRGIEAVIDVTVREEARLLSWRPL